MDFRCNGPKTEVDLLNHLISSDKARSISLLFDLRERMLDRSLATLISRGCLNCDLPSDFDDLIAG
jgi:hypothetical protein